jgi:hypothetical protein
VPGGEYPDRATLEDLLKLALGNSVTPGNSVLKAELETASKNPLEFVRVLQRYGVGTHDHSINRWLGLLDGAGIDELLDAMLQALEKRGEKGNCSG